MLGLRGRSWSTALKTPIMILQIQSRTSLPRLRAICSRLCCSYSNYFAYFVRTIQTHSLYLYIEVEPIAIISPVVGWRANSRLRLRHKCQLKCRRHTNSVPHILSSILVRSPTLLQKQERCDHQILNLHCTGCKLQSGRRASGAGRINKCGSGI